MRESAKLEIPKQLPNVTNLGEWKISVSLALVQASGYGDRREVAWFQECNDGTRSFESFADSGGPRFAALDDKLGAAIQSVQDTNPSFTRGLLRLARQAYGKGKILTGRQMCYILFRQLKVNEDLGTYFSVQDLISVDWVGDSPQQVAKFRDQWLKVVDICLRESNFRTVCYGTSCSVRWRKRAIPSSRMT